MKLSTAHPYIDLFCFAWAVSTYECLHRTIIMVSIIRLSVRVRKIMPPGNVPWLHVSWCSQSMFHILLQEILAKLSSSSPVHCSNPCQPFMGTSKLKTSFHKQIKAHTDARTSDHVTVHLLLSTGWSLCLQKCHMLYLLELLSVNTIGLNEPDPSK